jgi:hypothetical protein
VTSLGGAEFRATIARPHQRAIVVIGRDGEDGDNVASRCRPTVGPHFVLGLAADHLRRLGWIPVEAGRSSVSDDRSSLWALTLSQPPALLEG